MGSNVMLASTITGGTQSALVAVDCPRNGKITGVTWGVNCDLDADLDQVIAQLSFGSVASSTNDSRQIISNCVIGASQITAASTVRTDANFHDPQDLPVSGGERVFLHSIATAGITGQIVVMIHFDFDIPGGRR